jgi:hypothetical protein
MTAFERQGELEQLFHELVQPLFEEKGFHWVPSFKQYRKLTPPGFQCVIFSFSHYAEGSLLEAHLGIRVDMVEQLAFPYTNGLPGFKEDSLTLVTPLARLFGMPFERFDLVNRQDVLQASRKIRYQLNEKGWRFLNDNMRLPHLDQLFNEQPEEYLQLVHNQANRCIRGLTIAKLNQDPNFPILAQIYRQQLEQIPTATDRIRRGFDRLFSFLLAYSPN